MAKKGTEIFDVLNNISSSQKKKIDEDDPVFLKGYSSPFMINRFLGGHIDTLLLSNEINKYPFVDKYAQYLFLFHGVRKKKRFFKMSGKTKNSNIELIQKYYGYSRSKALSVLQMFDQKDLDALEERMGKGGKETK